MYMYSKYSISCMRYIFDWWLSLRLDKINVGCDNIKVGVDSISFDSCVKWLIDTL